MAKVRHVVHFTGMVRNALWSNKSKYAHVSDSPGGKKKKKERKK